MKKISILILASILVSFGIYVFGDTVKERLKVIPNHAYKITFLVRSPDLIEGDIKFIVDKAWKVKRIPAVGGTGDWWQLAGQFTMLPPTIGGLPAPEGAGGVRVEEVRIETIDGNKVN
jgi:hypothetical protein